ncbi:MAG: hydrogenase maturation nickel metallochaperone HypA [Bacteroidales bacterium]|nr:hydrogenase maturation nickel metallochaperone HypA [Bacteroidales bacterium]
MHELAIAQSIVALAEQQAQNRHAAAIEEVELEIGVLAGVDVKALDFAMKSSVKGTLMENARIVRHDIAGEGRCGDCANVFPVNRLFENCPACGSYAVNILKGKELRMKSIVMATIGLQP